VNTPGHGHGERTSPEVFDEQPSQVSVTDAEARGQLVDPPCVERAAIDQP